MSQTHDENSELDTKYNGMVVIDLVRSMFDVQSRKDALEEQLKAINKEFDYLRLSAIPKKCEEEGIESMKVEGIGRLQLTGDLYVSIPADAKDSVYEWFDDIGKGDLITRTINASTLKATVKSMIKAGEEVNDLLKVTPFTRASIVKR